MTRVRKVLVDRRASTRHRAAPEGGLTTSRNDDNDDRIAEVTAPKQRNLIEAPMDEAFWSNVVKRWADASESVIKLKKELAILQRERTLEGVDHRGSQTRQDAFKNVHYVHHMETDDWNNKEDVASLPGPSTTRDELKDAEVGLVRAKEEYKRLQSELALSSERVRALSREKEELRSKHEEEVIKLKDIIHSLQSTPTLRALPSDLSNSVDTLRPSSKTSLARTPESEESRTLNLERKIESLMSWLAAKEGDNRALQHELTVTKDKLTRSEENQRLLLRSISKLQEITRSSLDHTLLHSDASHKSLRSFVSSNGGNLRAVEGKKELKGRKLLFASTMPSLHAIENTKDSAIAAMQRPPARSDIIADLPTVACPKLDPSQNMFDREFLKCALGNGVQTLLTHFTDSDEVDAKSLTTSYLCPTLNHHPWCPTTPGQHGFIFVGFGKDRNAYNTPVIKNLFVGLAKKQTHKRFFRYLGRYRVSRVNALTVDEWMGLVSETQKMLAKLFKDKENDSREDDDILIAFDTGELSIPCVQLQFVGFDESLYNALSFMKKEEQ